MTSFRIDTNDGERLFTWLIAPLGVYAKYSEDFIAEHAGVDDIEEKLAFRLLRDDPEARLLLYFHGNSATIAQQRRTEEYRSYSSGASGKIFVLAFDYRGFGSSSGTPSETGLLSDAEAVVEWAMHRARIPPERIVLLGHSLGTAVVSGIAHHYLKIGIEFAGLILCAAFTNAGGAFASYSIGGVVPVLAPVKLSFKLHAWFSRRMRDTWRSDTRLAEVARKFVAQDTINLWDPIATHSSYSISMTGAELTITQKVAHTCSSCSYTPRTTQRCHGSRQRNCSSRR